MSGFDCKFVEEPPEVLQTHCPVCQLVLCMPFQVTCCGMSFCRQCIQRVKGRTKSCPACEERRFSSHHNKGLQQPLYGFKVFCPNKSSGCSWQGELRRVGWHLNRNPCEEVQIYGCRYVEISCLYCSELYPRQKIKAHQDSECAERPFTCSVCKVYESTYADVVTSHPPVCKCRIVDCPNSCGIDDLQHQHLDDHVSTQCPLTFVDCNFSEKGCSAKMKKRDLPSHFRENVAEHMSLLVTENKKMKLQIKEQGRKLQRQSKAIKQDLRKRADTTSIPPLVFLCSVIYHPGYNCHWLSKPFYSHAGGVELQLEINYVVGSGDTFKGKYSVLSHSGTKVPTIDIHSLIPGLSTYRHVLLGGECNFDLEVVGVSKFPFHINLIKVHK